MAHYEGAIGIHLFRTRLEEAASASSFAQAGISLGSHPRSEKPAGPGIHPRTSPPGVQSAAWTTSGSVRAALRRSLSAGLASFSKRRRYSVSTPRPGSRSNAETSSQTAASSRSERTALLEHILLAAEAAGVAAATAVAGRIVAATALSCRHSACRSSATAATTDHQSLQQITSRNSLVECDAHGCRLVVPGAAAKSPHRPMSVGTGIRSHCSGGVLQTPVVVPRELRLPWSRGRSRFWRSTDFAAFLPKPAVPL